MSLDYFNTNIKNETSIGSQRVTFRIGNDSTPVPIHMTLMEISEALKPEFWKNLPERSIAVTAKRLRIKQKRTYLERAVLEYPAYVKARKLNGTYVQEIMSLHALIIMHAAHAQVGDSFPVYYMYSYNYNSYKEVKQ